MIDYEEQINKSKELLQSIKENLDDLKKLYAQVNGHWTYEDMIYRYYHQSFKVYGAQSITLSIVDKLKELLPGVELNSDFMNIVKEGTGKVFEMEHNKHWDEITRPIIEAYFHAKFFLEMMIKYGKELDKVPQSMPSGWAAVLYLYNLR